MKIIKKIHYFKWRWFTIKNGIVIAGFAGIGKTYLAKKYKNVIDLESSPYKYDYSNIRQIDIEKFKGKNGRIINKEFPLNYINAIKKAQKEYEIVLVWIHPEEILPYYDKYDIDYYLCFPNKEAVCEYKDRFINRGNTQEYIDKVLSSFDKRYIQFINNSHKKIILLPGETLEDALLKKNYTLIKKWFF